MNLQIIESLKKSIERQLSVLTDILSIEKEKHAILLSGKLKDFSQINQSLLDKLEELESSELTRNQVMEGFISNHQELFANETEVTFSMILDKITYTDHYEEMKSLYHMSREAVDSIKHYTNINKDLIETALNVLNITLQQENKEIDYTKRSEAQNSSILLNKVI